MIPLARPLIGEEEYSLVNEVLQSGMLVQGRVVAEFEALLAEACGRRHAVAVSNGTAALWLAFRAIGVGPKTRVFVPALTWPSPAHAAMELGAQVVPVDVDRHSWNALSSSYTCTAGDVVVAIDQFGNPVDADGIGKLHCKALIEDAACAIGSTFANGRACGSLGLMSCLSFHPRKVLTTGEGGAVLTDDDNLAAELRILRNHGQSSPGRFESHGLNWRMSELQAALGVAQMHRLSAIVRERQERAAELRSAIEARIGGRLTWQECIANAGRNEQTFGALLPADCSKDEFIAGLAAQGVQSGRLSYVISDIGTLATSEPLPIAREIEGRGISLPLFNGMTDAQVRTVVDAVARQLA